MSDEIVMLVLKVELGELENPWIAIFGLNTTSPWENNPTYCSKIK